MNVGILYVITAAVALLQIVLILNRTLSTEYKDTIEKPFCDMLKFFIVFTIFDIFWGVCFSKVFFISKIGYTIISYGFHSMGALSAFIWFGYVLYYVKAEEKTKMRLNIIRYALFVTQTLTLCSNLWNHQAFYVNEDGSYSMGELRLFLYMLQFSYYIVLFLYCVYGTHTNKEKQVLYRNAVLFSLTPLIFGMGQYIFYDAAMYSLGFMLSAFIIYSFNLTAQREAYLTEQTTKLSVDVYIDALTGLYNRRAYEDDLENYPSIPTEEGFTYITLDVNGLKEVNDNIGHDAGDEIIQGTAFCMRTSLGAYGKLYRIGGDEFVAMIFVDREKLLAILADFDLLVSEWRGKLTSELSISYGFARREDYPNTPVVELARTADKKMYQAKAAYYANKGVDRRGQTEAFHVMSNTYTKILKVNLTKDTYSIIRMEEEEKSKQMGFDERISVWLHQFALSGLVHEADFNEYMEKTSLDYLQAYFKQGNTGICIYYRRKIGSKYHRAMMEIVRGEKYTNDNQQVFLYVKSIDQ